MNMAYEFMTTMNFKMHTKKNVADAGVTAVCVVGQIGPVNAQALKIVQSTEKTRKKNEHHEL